jgi:hypothetical protein
LREAHEFEGIFPDYRSLCPQKAQHSSDIVSKNQLVRQYLSSALTLLVPRIRVADNPHHTLATNYLAVAADLFNRSTYFHLFQLPRDTRPA